MEWQAVVLVIHSVIHSLALVWLFVLWSRPVKRDIRLARLEADHEDILLRVQRLSGHVGRAVANRRQEQTDDDDQQATALETAQKKGEDFAAYKQRMRGLLAAGRIKHK